MLTKVEVTQEDINNGVCGRWDTCPAALAGKRAFPNLFAFEVFGQSIELYDDEGSCTTVESPEELVRFVKQFDDGEAVEPFTFEIDV